MSNKNQANQNTFISHLSELRSRLLKSFIFLIISFIICYFFSEEIYKFLVKPYSDAVLENNLDRRLIFTALHEAFLTYLKVAFFASFFITSPIFISQIWKFVAPGLYRNEKRAIMPFLLATPLLFMLGAAMVYYVVIPLAWEFFLSFEVAGGEGALPIEVEPRISEYLSLVMRLMFAFGVSFELPVILLLLVRAGIVTADDLAGKRKYAILLAFIAAAILTPPDVISQVMLAVPVIILYEISIIGARIIGRPPESDDD